MLSKQNLLNSIDNLVLVTAENRKRLTSIVEKLNKDEDLTVIEELIGQEPKIIKKILHAIIETEVKAKNTGLLKLIDLTLKKIQKEELKATHIQEKEEKASEEEEAEELLKHMD